MMTLALIASMSVLVFADDNTTNDKSTEAVETQYIPQNSEPASTVSTISTIEPYVVTKCWECGSSTRVVKKAIWELAPCGHYAYWDGSVCTNSKCEMPFVDRVYLTCNCH